MEVFFIKKLDMKRLKKLDGWYQGALQYRAMLDYIAPKCYVEAESSEQGGTVEKVIRNRYGIPVCVKVTSGDGTPDYISVDRINFFEPYDSYTTSVDEYDDGSYGERLIEQLLKSGYIWDPDKGYYNKETGDSVIW